MWSSVERLSVQGVQFLFMLIMARLLMPSDYGMIAMLSIFLAIAQSLIDCGFSDALIRKVNRTEADCSTVFYFNIVVSTLIYIILFIGAPWVADFYDTPELTSVMRISCLIIIINSLTIVQRALFVSDVDFKSQAKISLISALITGVIGIYLAYIGWGVWALVFQSISSAVVTAILFWLFSKWRPRLLYSWDSFRELFAFGSKMMASGLINTVYNNIYPIIIGKLFSATNLGYYTRAQQFAELPSSNITNILKRVTYPVMCKVYNDEKLLLNTYRKLIRISCFVVFPMMLCLSAVSEPFIVVALGEKWQPSARLLQIICFAMMLYPIHSLNLNLLQTKGRSDLILKLEILKKCFGLFVIFIAASISLEAMCYGMIVTSIFSLIVNTYYTGKLLNFGIIEQIKDISPSLIASMIMFGCTLLTVKLLDRQIISLILGCIEAIGIYVVISVFFKNESIKEIKRLIKK